MDIPQFEMQPLVPGAGVSVFPVSDVVLMQKSLVVPHWPHMLQQALRGHGFRRASFDMSDGCRVPGTCGPHIALLKGAGIGGEPKLIQKVWPS